LTRCAAANLRLAAKRASVREACTVNVRWLTAFWRSAGLVGRSNRRVWSRFALPPPRNQLTIRVKETAGSCRPVRQVEEDLRCGPCFCAVLCNRRSEGSCLSFISFATVLLHSRCAVSTTGRNEKPKAPDSISTNDLSTMGNLSCVSCQTRKTAAVKVGYHPNYHCVECYNRLSAIVCLVNYRCSTHDYGSIVQTHTVDNGLSSSHVGIWPPRQSLRANFFVISCPYTAVTSNPFHIIK
jgi:hypothetical protein